VGGKVEGTVRLVVNMPLEGHNEADSEQFQMIKEAMHTINSKKSSSKEKIAAQNLLNTMDLQKNFKMVMRMEGNSHTYYHDLHMLQITNQHTNIIPTDEKRSYILKLIVDDRYDCNGTQYVRYKIEKITKPTLQDFMTTEVTNAANQATVVQMVETYRGLVRRMEAGPQYRELDDKEKLVAYQDVIEGMLKYYQKYISKPVSIDLTNTSSNFDAIADPNIGETNAMIIDGRFLFTRKRVGRIFNYYTQVYHTIPRQLSEADITEPDHELVQRVVTKIVLANKFDCTLIKTVVGMINKEKPLWSINGHVLPLVMYAIQEACKSEATLELICRSINAKNIQAFKAGDMELTARNWKEAWNMRQVWKFLWMSLMTPINEKADTATTATTEVIPF
jgi:hypothetical protein